MARSPLARVTDWSQARPFAVDAGIVAVVAVLVVASRPEDLLLELGLVVPLAWRRRAPVATAVVVFVVLVTELALGEGFLYLNVVALVVVHALAAHGGRRCGYAGLALGLVGSVLGGVQIVGTKAPRELLLTVGAIAVSVVAAWAVGDRNRVRVQQVADLRERARLLEVEREQETRLAAGDERARIAREMHDVVAHSLSVVIAQADGGRYAGRTDPGAAAEALAAIGETGRAALADMRALLGVLRQGDDALRAPQPDVAAVGGLIEDVRAAGLEVELLVRGQTGPLPAGGQLTAYRIVQESLTNVLKHAGPAARARVELQWGQHALEVSVVDDGWGSGSAPTGAATEGAGQGVRGMRERVQLHGGALEVRPLVGAGYRVHCVLPYRVLS